MSILPTTTGAGYNVLFTSGNPSGRSAPCCWWPAAFGQPSQRPQSKRRYAQLAGQLCTGRLKSGQIKQSRTSNRSEPKRTSFRACRGLLPESSAPPARANEIPRQARNDVFLYPVTCAWALEPRNLFGSAGRRTPKLCFEVRRPAACRSFTAT